MKFIIIIIIAGILGFTLSILILVGPFSKSPFFEIEIKNKKEKVDALLDKRISSISEKLTKLSDDIKKPGLHTTETATISKEITGLEILLATSIQERNKLRLSNLDNDSTYYTKYFSIEHGTFFKLLNDEKFNISSIHLNVIDPLLIPTEFSHQNIIKGTAELIKTDPPSKVAFINKYPSFGFWLVMSIIQMCVWFITGTIIILLNIDTLTELNFASKDHKLKVFGYIILVVGVIALFLIFTYGILIDVYVIEDHIFLQNFTLRMAIFAVIGYSVASICFFIYLLLADQAHKLNTLQPAGFADKIQNLKNTFDYSFIFSALILSIFVFWLGIMFNAINKMDLMNYYFQISGKQYLNDKYIYYVGLLHTLLLLIFYIPVQLKFNSLEIVKSPKSSSTNTNSSRIQGFFTTLFEKFSPVLITTSPLITSFFHDVITSFINE